MSRLGARIAILMTLANMVVVGLATLLMIETIEPPRPPPDDGSRLQTEAELARTARDIENLTPDKSGTLSAERGIEIAGDAPEGQVLDRPTRALVERLRKHGFTGEARVIDPPEGGPPVLALTLAHGRWLLATSGPPEGFRGGPDGLGGPGGPPPFGSLSKNGLAFAFWMTLIALGATAVVVFAVMRATRPLAILERTVADIGPDGEFAELPEDGPPEVRATARAINLLSFRLKTAMESRMRLVAAAGHDLRTPMTRLRLRAEFLTDDDDRAKWLSDLDELDRIADSAISLVREEVDPDARQPTRIDPLLREIVRELVEIGLQAEVVRTVACEALVRPLAMKRALRNLTVNAATHGVSARLSVEVVRGTAVIAIEDEGPGIPPVLLERVFEPFFRVDPARGKSTALGAGLGLAIAKEIVARNCGTLTLANRPAGGLVQVVTLPLAPPGAAN